MNIKLLNAELPANLSNCGVNKKLYDLGGEYTHVLKHGGITAMMCDEVLIAPDKQRAFITVTLVRHSDGSSVVQPFYRSSGKNGVARGTWLPCQGLATSAWREDNNRLDLPPGWIIKKQYNPTKGEWCSHDKTPRTIDSFLTRISKELEQMDPACQLG